MKTKKFFNPFLLFFLGISLIGYSQESSDYEMFQLTYVQAKLGHEIDFSQAVKSHNENFHNEAPNTASLDLIMSGRQAGWYAWVLGPCTFTKMETIELGEAHNNDWNNNVVPHIARYGATEYWQFNPALSYVAVPYEEVNYMTVIFLDVKRGTKDSDITALFKNLKEASEKKGVDFREYFSRFGSSNGRRGLAIVIGHRNMAALDINKHIRNEYTELFGEDGWQKAVDQWNTYFTGVNVELWKSNAY